MLIKNHFHTSPLSFGEGSGVRLSGSKVRTFLLTLLTLSFFSHSLFAIDKRWSTNFTRFSSSMSMVAIVVNNGVEKRSETIEIAAFSGTDCRGSVLLQYVASRDRYIGYLMIYGEGNETITLKVYDHDTSVEYNASNASLIFAADAIYGNSGNPFMIVIGSAPTPPAITTADLPDGTVAVTYSQTLTATSVPSAVWTVSAGNLPVGLGLSTEGVISGTPTIAGFFNFTVNAANNSGENAKEMSITINKGEPIVTFPTGATLTYEQTLADAIFTGGSGDGIFAFVNSTFAPTVSQSGTSYEVAFTPTDADNYNIVTQNVTVTVGKANPTVTFPTDATLFYEQTLAEAVFAGGSGDGIFAFVNSTFAPTVAHSGTTYEVSFTPTDIDNYNILTQNITITVNEANPNITFPTEATLIYGQTLADAIFINSSGDGIFAYINSTFAPTVAQSGTAYSVTFTPTDTDNYNSITHNVMVIVSKADPIVTFPTEATLTFGETLADVVFTGGSGDGRFSFVNSTFVPTVAESGTEYEVRFTPNDVANYNILTDDVTVTVIPIIDAVMPTINTFTEIDVTYTQNAEAEELSVSASIDDEGILTYQWYNNVMNSNTNGVAIPDATEASYTPSTMFAGTMYYYVVVTNTNNNVNGTTIATVTSYTAAVTVTETRLLGIEVAGKDVTRTGNNFFINAQCDDFENNQITISVLVDNPLALVLIGGVEGLSRTINLINHGDNEIVITLITQNAGNQTYTLTINNPVPFEQIVKVRYNNTLVVINNPTLNGGYMFSSYRWFKDGTEIGVGQSWSAGANGEELSSSSVYHVEVVTLNHQILRSCESNIALKNIELKAYPNPVSLGQTLYIETDEILIDTVIEVYDIFGRCVDYIHGVSTVDIHYPTGIYVFVIKGNNGFRKELKIIVE